MAWLKNIFKKSKKKKEERIKRQPQGALKAPASRARIEEKPAPEPKKEKKITGGELSSQVILSPHFTEKSTEMGDKGAYVFKVASGANKVMIRRSMRELYEVENRFA